MYIKQLDGIRTIAIFGVLFVHGWGYPAGHTILNQLAEAGWIGVDLFFVLSGFLISRILIAAKDQPNYFRNFYARRTLRIFPIYYLLLATVFFVLPLFSQKSQLLSARADGIFYALYLSNFAIAATGWHFMILDITWSLSVEEQFYLIWPGIVKWLRSIVPLCIGLVIALPIIRTGLWFAGVKPIWLYIMMPLRADAFAMGALLAVTYKSRHALRVILPLSVVSTTLLLVLITTGSYSHDFSMLVNTVGYTLNALVSVSLLGLALLTKLSIPLSWQPVVYIGKISYGAYIFHPACFSAGSKIVDRLGMQGLAQSVMQLIVVGAMTIMIASLSYAYFEKPFLRLKRHFDSNPSLDSLQTN